MATTTTTISGPLHAMLNNVYQRAYIRLAHDLDLSMGRHAEAIRARARHPWLRLAGPKGRLP